MDWPRAQSLIVFGGSFDPPHLAHLRLPLLAMQAVGADGVLYIPSANPPHKRNQTLADASHRLAMLRLALQDQPHAAIWTDELDRAADGQPSYTVDTLTRLRHHLGPQPRLRLLIGSDQLRLFPSWRQYQEIIALAEPLVMVRPPLNRQSLLADLPAPLQAEQWAARLLELPALDISATDIRRRVAAGQPINHLVPPAVAAYIAAHGLYRANSAAH
ncbi:MAG: nicotinate (nicotinamide) nucleotide adenylyltransferase [Phycisphaeraceae bacterium]|nr:nicotinate (nicotinamide) nucleotide adenylyltransferase [Phycisphaeraceae bacterium]